MKTLLSLSIVLTVFLLIGDSGLVQGQKAGQNETYTPAERRALKQLSEAVKDIVYLDYQKKNAYLINWLRDQELSVEKAKQKLAKSLKWRKENNIDNILEEKALIALEKVFPFAVKGMDKEGRPIYSYKIRDWDIRKYLLSGKVNLNLMKRYSAYQYEKAALQVRENSAKLGKDVSQWINVIDMSGFNLRTHGCFTCVPIYSDVVSMYMEHYPNSMSRAVYINAPRALETMAKVFRPITPQILIDATSVFGLDTNEWKPYLLQYMDEDQIPRGFAGANSAVRG